MIERHDSMNTSSDAPGADRIRESVSALLDGEAGELELRRLLGGESAATVRTAWRDYHLQRDALQGVDMRFAGFDISARVQAAIAAQEEAPAVAAAGSRWWRPLASMAVAASVATVVVIGARFTPSNNGFDAGRTGNLVAQASSANVNRVHAELGNVSAGVQPFGPLAAGNGLPGTVFPRNEVVGKGFPGAQTAAFDVDQAQLSAIAQQQRMRYLMQQRAVNNQGVISFAKVSRLSEE
jgi:sigma-E factor negative regulatory protein RseA